MASEQDLERRLGLGSTVALGVGSIVGSGIFFVPAAIATRTHSASVFLGLWLVGGLLSLFGALAIAELGAAQPRAGGLYVYLRRAYGPLAGFLYGWASFWVINTAAVSAIAVAFGSYLASFLGLAGVLAPRAIAVAVVVLLTGINAVGLRWGAAVQNVTTSAKVVALAVLVGVAFLGAQGSWENLMPSGAERSEIASIGPLGLALIPVLWSYDGWVEISYAAGEIENPRRTIPRALALSLACVTVLYVLVNAAYVHVLSLDGVRASKAVASDTVVAGLGVGGGALVTVAILLSTFGAANGFLLGASRIYFAMARDGLFPRRLARVHPRTRAPVASLLAQGAWGGALALSGTFEQLFSYVVFASWLFYGLCAAAVFVERRRHGPPASYRAWGHPYTTVAFLGFALLLAVNAIMLQPLDAAVGMGLILSGVPVFAVWRARRKK